MNKAKIIFKIVALVAIPLTGYLAAKANERYNEELDQLYMEKDDADVTTTDKIIVAVKSYAFAVIAGATGIASILAMDHINGKALAAAGLLATANKRRIQQEIDKFNTYRKATLETVGEDTEREICKKVGDVYIRKSFSDLSDESDEVEHEYHLQDWLYKDTDIAFNATTKEVMTAFENIVSDLYNPSSGSGIASVSDFLSYVGHPDLICDETDNHTWNTWDRDGIDWMKYKIEKRKGEVNSFNIIPDFYPNYIMSMCDDGVAM